MTVLSTIKGADYKSGVQAGLKLATLAITFNIVLGLAFWANNELRAWKMKRQFKKMQEAMITPPVQETGAEDTEEDK